MDIQFNHLGYLHLLWVVMGLLVVVLWGFARRRRTLARFASRSLHDHLLPNVSASRRKTKVALVLSALGILVLAMTDPRWGEYYQEVQHRGIDIVFALDVSRSMLAEDVMPNRLERAKQDINDVLDVLVGDRVALVTFAGSADLKCPLTVNYSAFKMTLDEVSPESSPRGGTLIGDAIRKAVDCFVDKQKKYKAIILITDGDDQESFPVEAARQAYRERGIRIYTVGIGDMAEGARVPIEQDGQRLYLKHEGQEVWSRMGSETLEKMAVAGGGVYVPAGTKQIELDRIYKERIATTETRQYQSTHVRRYHVQYQWFAGAALILLLVESWLSEVKVKTTPAPVRP